MREEWYVVPARYAFKLREVLDPEPEEALLDPPDAVHDAVHDAGDDDTDALVDGLHAASIGLDGGLGDEPPPPRHLPRTSRGHLKR